MRVPLSIAFVLVLALPAPAHGGRRSVPRTGRRGRYPRPRPRDVRRRVARGSRARRRAAGTAAQRARRSALRGADVRYRLPSAWCGTPRTTDFRDTELNNGPFRYHAIYALPADAPDRFAELATTLQADAFQASGLLEATYGRAIRFDLGTDCGPQYLDIAIVRLPQTTADLERVANTATGTLDAVSNAINAAGFPTIRPSDTVQSASLRDRNFIVWFDGPTPSGACGQATSYDDPTRDSTNLNNLGGKVAVVFPNGSGGFCSSNTVRHEIGHNLGALQRLAPNAFDGAHCDDAYEDTMCYSQSPKVANGQRGLFFDYGNNDYWDPPKGAALPWWTANLNRFLCPDAACNVASAAGDSALAVSDTDGDGVADDTDVCPDVADPDQRDANGDGKGDACPATGKRPTVRLTAKRAKKGWKVTVSARGKGRAIVSVRCRRTRRGSVRTVYAKRTSLPRTLRKTVACASRPSAGVIAYATR